MKTIDRKFTAVVSAVFGISGFALAASPELIGHWPMDAIVVKDGVRMTPDVSGKGHDMLVGDLVSETNGVRGAGALFFNAGKVTSSETWESWGKVTNIAIRGFTVLVWSKRDKAIDVAGGGRLLKLGADFQVPTTQSNLSSAFLSVGNGFVPASVSLDPAAGRAEEWAHTAIVVEPTDPTQKTGMQEMRVTVYRNGVRTGDTGWNSCSSYLACSDAAEFWLANASTKNRPFRGTIDDVQIYSGCLTEAEIRTVYHGPACVLAGESFSVATDRASLVGKVSFRSVGAFGDEHAGDVRWSLVSAPEGVEAVDFADDRSVATGVTLPQEGSYAFRLTAEGGNVAVSDDVTVTRVASAGGENAPELSLESVSVTGLCAVVKATVADADGDTVRMRWQKKSGPGGVWFADAAAANAFVIFSAAGSYELSCVASDGLHETERTLSVTVSGKSPSELIKDGLGAYWNLDYGTATGNAQASCTDPVSGKTLTSRRNYSNGVTYEPGIAGTYTAQLENQTDTYFTSDYLVSEGPMEEGGATAKEEWTTFSCWMYHDGSDTRSTWMATLFCGGYCNAFHYHCDGGAANDFEFVSQVGGSQFKDRFKGPGDINFTNNWIHVVGQLRQRWDAVPSEVWVNGRKLTGLTNNHRTTRYISGTKFQIGGCVTHSDTDEGADNTSHRFPGKLDEIRFWRRHLSEAEIRYLYECPAPDNVNLPAQMEVDVSSLRPQAKANVSVSGTVSAEKPATAYTYEWVVEKGDAANVEIANPASLATTAVFKKSGQYVLRLKALENGRISWSIPVPIDCQKNGLMLILR